MLPTRYHSHQRKLGKTNQGAKKGMSLVLLLQGLPLLKCTLLPFLFFSPLHAHSQTYSLKATVWVVNVLLFSQLHFNQGVEHRMFHRCIFAGETTALLTIYSVSQLSHASFPLLLPRCHQQSCCCPVCSLLVTSDSSLTSLSPGLFTEPVTELGYFFFSSPS